MSSQLIVGATTVAGIGVGLLVVLGGTAVVGVLAEAAARLDTQIC